MNDPVCPQCGAVHIVKNGHAHTGNQRYLCRECHFQFTLNAVWHRISLEKAAEVDRLLTERISHRGICRVTGVSRSWFRLHLINLKETVQRSVELETPSAKKV